MSSILAHDTRKLSLRPANADDAEALFRWRSDPVTMEACADRAALSWDGHVAWLERTLANPQRRLLIIERDGQPMATARFDYDDPTEFSFTIAPEHRGRGSSLKMMKLAMSAERAFVAHIRAENTACQRLVQACGMTLLSDGPLQLWGYGDHTLYTKDACKRTAAPEVNAAAVAAALTTAGP